MQGRENPIDIAAIIKVLERMREDPRFRSKPPAQKFYEALAMTDSTFQSLPEWRDFSPAEQARIESIMTTLLYGQEDD